VRPGEVELEQVCFDSSKNRLPVSGLMVILLVPLVPDYLKLTEEIGEWGGGIAKAQLPDFFEVDCLRVYEMSK
jgi:hypothetical protein